MKMSHSDPETSPTSATVFLSCTDVIYHVNDDETENPIEFLKV